MSPIDLAGSTLLHFVWQGTVVGMATMVLLQTLRRRSPQARYAAACAAMLVMLALPVLTALTLSRSTVESIHAESPAAIQSFGAPVRAPSDASRADTPMAPAARVSAAHTPWLTIVVAVWMAGVVVLLARVARARWSVQCLSRAAFASPPSRFIADAERLSLRLGLRRALRVVDSIEIDTPAVVGWLKPVVLLPVTAMANLTPAQVEAV